MVQLFQNFAVLEKLYVLYRCYSVGCEKVRQGAPGAGRRAGETGRPAFRRGG